jgi:hypothetical protein
VVTVEEPGNKQMMEEERTGSLLVPQRKCSCADTWISDRWPPEPAENKFPLFEDA